MRKAMGRTAAKSVSKVFSSRTANFIAALITKLIVDRLDRLNMVGLCEQQSAERAVFKINPFGPFVIDAPAIHAQ